MYALLLPMAVEAQYLIWNRLIEEQSSQAHSSISAMDVSQNGIVLSGEFGQTIDLDPDSIAFLYVQAPVANTNHGFFSRYDQNGSFVWGRQIEAWNEIKMGGQVVDGQGNIFLAGSFNDTVDLNPGTNQAYYIPQNNGAEDFFLVKYNSNGLFQWGRQMPSTVFTGVSDFEMDGSGNLVVVGNFEGTTDFDPGGGVQNATATDRDIFISKYNSSGNFLISARMGVSTGSGQQDVQDAAIDGSDNIYITGRFSGTVDFDPGSGVSTKTANGADDIFIAKYNSLLQLQWVYQLGGSGAEGNVRVDLEGSSIWLAGSFTNTADLDLKSGTSSISSSGDLDFFLARYDLSANLISSGKIGGSGKDEVTSLHAHNNDSVMISGHFEGSVDFDPGPGIHNLSASSANSAFLSSFGNSCHFQWATSIGGSGDVFSTVVRSTEDGNPILAGNLQGTADFNASSPFTKNYTGPASFFARFDKCDKMKFQFSVSNADCGERTGSISASTTGGTLPLRYFWTSGHTTPNADSLRSGMYFLTVIDTNNCTFNSPPVTISDANAPDVSVTAKLDVSCHGGNDGALVLGLTGGVQPYTFSWSNGKTTKDVNLLSAGNYEVTVTDAAGCKTIERFEVSEPAPIHITPIVSAPLCGNSDGAVTGVVTGGTPGYTLNWTPGGSGATLFNIGAGVYRLNVTDQNNCSHTRAIPVGDYGAASVLIDSIVHAGCGSGGGGIFVTLAGGNPGFTYAWTPGSLPSEDITGLQPNEYDLIATDNLGCKSAFTAKIEAEKPKTPQICIVDVDSLTGYAQVLWEKPVNRGSIRYYNIFRETTSQGRFNRVADSLDFSDLSMWDDDFADTWVRPWTYRISLTDTCGIESEMSSPHTTIHTVITKNAQGEFNVLWSPYRGNFQFYEYTCWRYTDSTSLDSVTTVPANVFSYTDRNSPSQGGDVYYVMQIRHPNGCTATESSNKNSSRSNRGSINPPFGDTLISVFETNRKIGFNIYPNPAGDFIRISTRTSVAQNINLTITDIRGVEMIRKNLGFTQRSMETEISTTMLKPGMYLMILRGDYGVSTSRLIIGR